MLFNIILIIEQHRVCVNPAIVSTWPCATTRAASGLHVYTAGELKFFFDSLLTWCPFTLTNLSLFFGLYVMFFYVLLIT